MATADKLGWAYGKSALERHRHMLDTGLGSDVCFEVGNVPEGQQVESESGTPCVVRAHRCILICCSAVFEQLLSEAVGNAEQRIKVPDVQPEAFKALLR